MKKDTLIILSFFAFTSVFTACGKEDDTTPTPNNNETPTPIITSITPNEGKVGDEVTIVGTDLSSASYETFVKVNGVAATISSNTGTVLVFIVPDASSGKVTITVNDKTATSTNDFTVIKDVAIPQAGLIAFYPFTGNANDMSTSGFNGTNNGAALSFDRYAHANACYLFKPVDYIDMGNQAAFDNVGSSFSLSAWIKPTSTSITSSGAIISNFNDGSAGYRLSYSNNSVIFEIEGGVGYLSKSGQLTSQTWANVTATYNGTEMKIYVNGALVATKAATGAVTPTGLPFQIGKESWANVAPSANFFDGYIDDILVYNRALTDQEVMDVYLQTETK